MTELKRNVKGSDWDLIADFNSQKLTETSFYFILSNCSPVGYRYRARNKSIVMLKKTPVVSNTCHEDVLPEFFKWEPASGANNDIAAVPFFRHTNIAVESSCEN